MKEEITNTLEEIGKKLNEEYLKAGTKSKRKQLIYELFSFSVLCEEEFGIQNKHLWFLEEELFPNEDNFLNIINNDKKNYLSISKSVIDNFIKIEYPFYSSYNKPLPKISIDQIKDIVFSFLDDFDKNIANKLRDKVKENKVFITRLSEMAGGYINPFEFLKDGIIVINNSDGYNLNFAQSLVHECGHLYELEHLYSQNRKMYRTYSMSTPYYEVSSSFLEYAFLRYIKDNRILNHSIDTALNTYYIELFIYSLFSNLICMKKELTTENGFIYITEDHIKKYAENIMNKSNYYEPQYYSEGIDSRFPFIYSLGHLLSIYMYENYVADKEKFIQEFKRSFLIYPTTPTVEAFNKVGVNYQEIKEGKKLRKVLQEYTKSH